MESPNNLPLNVALIVGCARSGTSILGELIAAHPQVRYVFEAIPIWERAGVGENESHRLTAEHMTPALREETRDWARRELQGASLLVGKSPRNVLRILCPPFFRGEDHSHHPRRQDVALARPRLRRRQWSPLKPPRGGAFREPSGALRYAVA
jgi:hypothetical protein